VELDRGNAQRRLGELVKDGMKSGLFQEDAQVRDQQRMKTNG